MQIWPGSFGSCIEEHGVNPFTAGKPQCIGCKM